MHRIRLVLRRLWHWLVRAAVALAALLLLLEDWLWDWTLRLTERFAQHPLVRLAEARLAALPPMEALCAFALPLLALLPFKLAALYMIARGHLLTGALLLVAAKLPASALASHIYLATRPQLMSLGWFARLHDAFLGWKARLFAALETMPAWTRTRQWAAAVRADILRRRREH
jgi:hypothetical protein